MTKWFTRDSLPISLREPISRFVNFASGLPRRLPAACADLRNLLWSSIDNDTSRDLDQIEVAERVPGGIRVMVGIADVDSGVAINSPIDQHASSQTTSVYTAVRTFPMLPEELSTDLTSLNEDGDRLAIVIEFVVGSEGAVGSESIYRALVRNRAQLTYNGVGPWLEGTAGCASEGRGISRPGGATLKLQDAASVGPAGTTTPGWARWSSIGPNLRRWWKTCRVHEVTASRKTRANDLIEDFMVDRQMKLMARGRLKDKGRFRPSTTSVVEGAPERWPRIVLLAKDCGDSLPEETDSGALNAFLQRRRVADPVHYPDLSLAVVKLMGPGEYVLSRADADQGHFGLATHDYTHSTAPNRRFR